uniref:EB domain-containing protein n=1 Tax=Angiostrongylus cantonensis TaxID=6313 RepID=A0A0K0CYM3_ANGCA
MGAEMEQCSDVGVVKEIDSKSIGLCPPRFESCSLRIFCRSARDSYCFCGPKPTTPNVCEMGAEMEQCSDVGVVKEIDSKSVELCPRRSARDSYYVFVDRNRQHLMHLKWTLEKKSAAMFEWLRRLTRNQLGSDREGSNPARCEYFAEVLVFRTTFLWTETGITKCRSSRRQQTAEQRCPSG